MTPQQFKEKVLPFIEKYYFNKEFVMNPYSCSLGNITISYSPLTKEWEIIISQSNKSTVEGKGLSLNGAYINLLGFDKVKNVVDS